MELRIPPIGESISEATLSQWLKQAGDLIQEGDPVATIETDKVTLEIPSPITGVLKDQMGKAGKTYKIGSVIGILAESSAQSLPSSQTPPSPLLKVGPAARVLAQEKNVDLATVTSTSPHGTVSIKDILKTQTFDPSPQGASFNSGQESPPSEKKRPLSPLRKRLSERLKEAQNTAVMLTTFNEIDMSAAMALRTQYGALFEKKYEVKLGFMSLFARATLIALNERPILNSYIEDGYIVSPSTFNLGIAVGTEAGLVVPVIKAADTLSTAELEKEIATLAQKARAGKLSLENLQGGTFTLTNGGVYGSLFSPPPPHPPQSAILGIHKIEERPVALEGQVVIRPMMYVALTYDHRLIDGREAVGFLNRIKELMEAPERMALEI